MVATYTEGDEPVPGYRLIRPLGWGRFGEVWKASAPGGFEAAVKFISLGNLHGLKEYKAIRLFKQIRHPNLVPLMALWLKDKLGNFIDDAAVGETSTLHVQAAELIIAMGVGDKSLYDRLKECREEQHLPGVPVDELLNYVEQAGFALDFLNQPTHDLGANPAGIQHCDIKPHNILIVGTAAQICDLGVARVLQDPRATAAMGSAAYIAPECIQHGRPSNSTDQYSLAITYVELRTGSLPFEAKTVAAAYMAHLHGRLDLSGLPKAEQEVIRRATAVNPNERYPTIRDMVRDLRQAVGENPLPPIIARPVSVSETAHTEALAGTPEERAAVHHDCVLTDTSRPAKRHARITQRIPTVAQLQEARRAPGAAVSLVDIELPTWGQSLSRRSEFAPKEPDTMHDQDDWPGHGEAQPEDAAPPPPPSLPPQWVAEVRALRRTLPRKFWITLILAIVVPALAVPGLYLFSFPVPVKEHQETAAIMPPEDSGPAEVVRPAPKPVEPPPQPVTPAATKMPQEVLKRARAAMSARDFVAAIASYSELLQTDAEPVAAYDGRARAHFELGHYEDAAKDASAALKRDARDTSALHTRAEANLRLGENEQTLADCNALLAIKPDDANAFFFRGCAYSQKHQHSPALADYTQATRLHSQDTRAWHERTHAGAGVGKLDRAISEFSDAVRKDPKNAIAYAERGHALLHKGLTARAFTDSNVALELRPDYPEAHCVRGECYRQKGQPERAILECTEAARLDPHCKYAYLFRGVAYLDLGNSYELAIADFDRVIQLDPQLREAYVKRSSAYAILGDYKKAAEDRAKIQQLDARSAM